MKRGKIAGEPVVTQPTGDPLEVMQAAFGGKDTTARARLEVVKHHLEAHEERLDRLDRSRVLLGAALLVVSLVNGLAWLAMLF